MCDNPALQAKLRKLPRRPYWFTSEIAIAFGVSKRAVQNLASKHGIGKKVRQGPRGTWVYEIEDVEKLLVKCHGKRGNPNFGK